ncbi:MAG: zinc ribbon domain-containing protein [Oscillospiraceae bacterium]|nr:zinc ribbon domain-containing protein [Oscillospiraceae bacterium]
MYCAKCGNQLSAEIKFCNHCGAGVQSAEHSPPENQFNPSVQPAYYPGYFNSAKNYVKSAGNFGIASFILSIFSLIFIGLTVLNFLNAPGGLSAESLVRILLSFILLGFFIISMFASFIFGILALGHTKKAKQANNVSHKSSPKFICGLIGLSISGVMVLVVWLGSLLGSILEFVS